MRTKVLYHRNAQFARGVGMVRKNLQDARKAAGLTQQAIADKLILDCRYYKSIESGDRLGGIWLWDKLEDLLGVNQRVLREIHLD